MYFHQGIKASAGNEAYLLLCKINNGTSFFSILNLTEINIHQKREREREIKEKKKKTS